MRDTRFVAAHRRGLLPLSDHHLLAAWAADCAEQLLPLFERDSRDVWPRHAISKKQSEGDQPDVAAAGWALERKLLAYPGHELRPRLSGKCHANRVFDSDSRRSSLPWRDRRPHARRSRPRTTCGYSRSRAPSRLFAACDSAQTPRDIDAGASAAAGRDRRGGRPSGPCADRCRNGRDAAGPAWARKWPA